MNRLGFTGLKTKRLARTLVVLFIALLLPCVSYAAQWDGSSTADPTWSGGVYEIATPAQLAGMRDWVNAGTSADAGYRLTADIDLGGHEWTPIGIGTYQGIGPASGKPFEGRFDGNGYTICDFKIASNDYGRDVAGLFGFVRSGGAGDIVIRNLTVSGALIDVRAVRNGADNMTAAGGLVGYQEGVLRIEDCAVGADISADVLSNATPNTTIIGAYAGGLVGFASDTFVVRGSSTTGSIKTNAAISSSTPFRTMIASMAGGLAGFVGQELKIEDSEAAVNVFADGPSDPSAETRIYAGGIIGSIAYPFYGGNIVGYHLDGVFASGTVYSSGTAGGLVGHAHSEATKDLIENSFTDVDVALAALPHDNDRRIGGGLVGFNGGGISNSAAFGDVTGGLVLGGLVGNNYGPYANVRQSYSTGDVTAGVADAGVDVYVGGLVGMTDGTFEDCYARGNVDATAASGARAVYAGGAAGQGELLSGSMQIKNVYSYGDVRGGASNNFYTGGLVGRRNDVASAINSAWYKPADGSANASLEIATGLNSLGQRGDSDFATAGDLDLHVSSMDVMTPEGKSIFSAVKNWDISSADSVPTTVIWTWTMLDGEVAPVLRAFFADDARTRLNGDFASISPKRMTIGPGEAKFAALFTLGLQPENIRVSPSSLGGVSIEATPDGSISLRAANETTAAASNITVGYSINGHDQPELKFALTVRGGNANGLVELEAPTFHNMPADQTWIKSVPIPSVAFSATQPYPDAAIWSTTSGLPRGISTWTRQTYTPSGGIERLDVTLSGKPATVATGTVKTEAMTYSYSSSLSPSSSAGEFPYVVLDDGSPAITGIPTAVQFWERGVAIQTIAVQIDKGVGGKIANVSVGGLPPGVLSSTQPDPSGADGVLLEISGAPTAMLTSGKILIEASSANGAVATGEVYYRMTNTGEPYITGVPTAQRDWPLGKPITEFKISAIQNIAPIEDVEIIGLPDGVLYTSDDTQAGRVTLSVSGTPTTESAGDVGIFARTSDGVSYVKFAYSVTEEGRPVISRVPTLTQQWEAGTDIVPVAVRIQGRHNTRIVRAEASGIPDGIKQTTSHVSSTDIWIALTGAPSGVGGGSIGIYAEAENGETATASFFYSVGSEGGGNSIAIIPTLPPDIALEPGETPITHIPPENIVIVELPTPNTGGGLIGWDNPGGELISEDNPGGGLIGEDGAPLPPGVLVPGRDIVKEGSLGISVDLGNGTSGDVLALEYEISLLDHEYFTNWPNLDEAGRVKCLNDAEALLAYEYVAAATARNTPERLIGDGGVISWAGALSEGVARTTGIGIVVRYIITDRDDDPFVSAGFLVIPDGMKDDCLIDPLWFLVRDKDSEPDPYGGGSNGCSAGGFGLVVGVFLLAAKRRKRA